MSIDLDTCYALGYCLLFWHNSAMLKHTNYSQNYAGIIGISVGLALEEATVATVAPLAQARELVSAARVAVASPQPNVLVCS